MALEGMAAEVLALQSRSAPKDLVLERREAETRSMEAGIKKGDLDRWAAADDQFHRILTGECGNRRLARMAGTIRDQTHRTRLLTLRLRPKPLNSIIEHWAIIEAIRIGNVRAAAGNAVEHRRRASEMMIPLLEKLNSFGNRIQMSAKRPLARLDSSIDTFTMSAVLDQTDITCPSDNKIGSRHFYNQFSRYQN